MKDKLKHYFIHFGITNPKQLDKITRALLLILFENKTADKVDRLLKENLKDYMEPIPRKSMGKVLDNYYKELDKM